MRYLHLSFIMVMVVMISNLGCHTHGPDSHTHDDGSHTHTATSMQVQSYTIWTPFTELFVEFDPLIVGQETSFLAHLTDLNNHKPVEDCTLTVVVHQGNNIIAQNTVTEPIVAGIYQPSIILQTEGSYHLDFVVKTGSLSDTFSIKDVTVYLDEATASESNPIEPEGNEISFLKEQAWKIDFATETAKRKSINDIIHTSGEFLTSKSDESIISAKSSGLVFFKNSRLQEGIEVNSGESLFNISSEGLLKSNMSEQFNVSKARLEKAKADFERSQKLVEQQIIGKKEYEARKMNFSIAEAEFETLTKSYNPHGQSVLANTSGIIKNIFVTHGQFVNEGDPLMEISRNKHLLLQAELPQGYLSQLREIKSANFITPYHDEYQSTDDYNGRIISSGKIIKEGKGFIPLIFELDNIGDLIPGSFAEILLMASPTNDALVIPKTALMKDYESQYVIIQTEGESFEKTNVTLGVDDGIYVQILDGINEGDRVVTKGAYQVKMASMSSATPDHGHAH